jgi:uncharacterized Zn-binding protein involved in type VI secretion
MPEQCRVMDVSFVPKCAHTCIACPHPAIGPAIKGSPDVYVNQLPAFRVTDKGVHIFCCGSNSFEASAGSATVFINNLKAHRKGDKDMHCKIHDGTMQTGSPNVMTGG